MTCRYCLLACTLCNIPSTASHFLSAFCLFSLDRLSRLCFCSLFPLFQTFSLCWSFSLCSEELCYTETEPNADTPTAESESNWKSSHLDAALKFLLLRPGARHCLILHPSRARAVSTIILKPTAATGRQGGFNCMRIWCLPLMASEEVGTKGMCSARAWCLLQLLQLKLHKGSGWWHCSKCHHVSHTIGS